MREDRYMFDVLDVCQAIHTHLSGASDPLDNYTVFVDWLRYRLESWQKPAQRYAGFDLAVKKLVIETLYEVDRAAMESESTAICLAARK